jgi:hypothetical protein
MESSPMAQTVSAAVQRAQYINRRPEQYSLERLEQAAFSTYNALCDLIWSARAVIADVSQPLTLTMFPGDGTSRLAYRIAPTPRQRLLADYLAFQEFEGFPDFSGPALAWLERVIESRRASTLILPTRRYTTALRALRELSEWTLPVPHDPFCARPLFELLWEGCDADPELSANSQTNSPRSYHRASWTLRRDFFELCFALRCWLHDVEIPQENSASPTHCRLVTVLRRDKRRSAIIRRVRAKELAEFLDGLVNDDDLSAIGTELQWEFTQAATLVNGLVPPLPDAVEEDSLDELGRDERIPEPDPRGEFAYNLVCDTTVKLEVALARFNREATNHKPRWKKVGHIQGLKHIASTHARTFKKPAIPIRSRGR